MRKKKLGITRKKKTTFYIERDEEQRQDFMEKIKALPEDTQIYYADESGFEEYYTLLTVIPQATGVFTAEFAAKNSVEQALLRHNLEMSLLRLSPSKII